MHVFDLQLSTFTLSIFKSLFLNVTVTAILVALAWFKNGLFRALSIAVIYLRHSIDRKSIILVWVDKRSLTEKLASRLERTLEENFRVVPLRSPEQLFRFPQNRNITRAVILMVTDVTKLSEVEERRERIQDWLKEYVLKGGGLVGGHDIIYRRTRNTVLEEIFGGRLLEFSRMEKVRYAKNPGEESVIFRDLPEEFELDDGEIVWGKWNDDVRILFKTPVPDSKPLVTFREYGLGRILWINSFDDREGYENPISKNDSNFMSLIRNAILLVSRQSQSERDILIIGHRGFSGKYPENTVLAFIKALNAGADGVELDVWLSKDGKAVVFHDSTLQRFTGNPTPVKDLTLNELKNVHMGAGQTIPSLEEVLKVIPHDTFLNIEIKDREAVEEVLEVLRENDVKNVVLTSFDVEILRDLKESGENFRSGLLKTMDGTLELVEMREKFSETLLLARELGLWCIVIPIESALQVSPDRFKEFLRRLRVAGLKIFFWAYADENFYRKSMLESLKSLYDGVITDHPERMKEFLNAG